MGFHTFWQTSRASIWSFREECGGPNLDENCHDCFNFYINFYRPKLWDWAESPLSRPSTEPSGICISFLPPRRREPKSSKRGSDSDSARSSPRPYAPTSRIGFPRRLAAGGRRQTVPRRSPIRGPLAWRRWPPSSYAWLLIKVDPTCESLISVMLPMTMLWRRGFEASSFAALVYFGRFGSRLVFKIWGPGMLDSCCLSQWFVLTALK